jgi:hypothetical protein
MIYTTPDLGNSFNPVPKPLKKEKSSPKPIKKIGKKGKLNLEATAELKKTSELLGITECEIKLNGCWKVIHGFAHGKKKRKLTPEELKKFAIGACNPCHDKIEYECEKWTGMTMEQFVRKTIQERKYITT